ncbi:MAG TPA: protein tyrosine phosphatase family protein [Mucilaginibacter sp.]|jgi:protein tyrosine phosphatase (PTP) superfamily phosphohydrolase (DUF442 family)|nr:protein tyrosine phosphatase family protein [Mucilaginibacter sp.]
MEIYNFREVSGLLACAGQPTESQLPAIAADGFKVVINLGLTDTKYALKDEAASVTALSMRYHHIPVLFEEPKADELDQFMKIMQQHDVDKTLVHCAANYRASVFTGLYLFATEKLDETKMHEFIEEVWQPNAVWDQFIEESVDFVRGKR